MTADVMNVIIFSHYINCDALQLKKVTSLVLIWSTVAVWPWPWPGLGLC